MVLLMCVLFIGIIFGYRVRLRVMVFNATCNNISKK